MKVLQLDSPVINEPELLKDREIQGLYSSKGACQSFWSLLSKVELSSFQEKKEVKT